MTYILLILMYSKESFAIQVPIKNEKYCIEAKNKIIANKMLFGQSIIECIKVK
jgi:hypothetical protein